MAAADTGGASVFQLGGDPVAIRASATRWAQAAATAEVAGIEIAAARVEGFRGGEGDTHGTWLTERFAPTLSMLSDGWGRVGRALSAFADELEDCQQELRRLSALASDDRSRIDAAGRAPAASAGRTTQKADAEASLAAVLRKSAAVRQRHDEAVLRCCTSTDRAKDLAPKSQPTLSGGLRIGSGINARWAGPPSMPTPASSRLGGVAARLRTAAATAAMAADRISSAAGQGWVARLPTVPRPDAMLPSPIQPDVVPPSATWSTYQNRIARNPKPWWGWKDNGPRHTATQIVAQQQIKAQVAARGGNPKDVEIEYGIKGASKNNTGNKGRADIVWTDNKNRKTYIWEVKGTVATPNSMTDVRLSADAAKDVAHYIKEQGKFDAARGWTTVPGFKLAHPLQVPFRPRFGGGSEMLTVRNGRSPGTILYTTEKNPKRGVPPPKLVPDLIPSPVPEPVPDKVPEPKLVPIVKPGPIFELPDWVTGAAIVGGLLFLGPGVAAVGGLAVLGSG